jgi:Fic family protein
MKLPEKPPLIQVLNQTLSSMIFNPTLGHDLYRTTTTQDDYLYWDKIKYLTPLLQGLDPKTAWSYVKWMRLQNAKLLPAMQAATGPTPHFVLTESLQKALHQIDRDAPRRIETDQSLTPETRDRYILNSLMEEAIASSQIEGAATTRDIAKDMLRTGRAPKDTSEKMILNNFLAMESIRALKEKPLSMEMILSLHRTLTQDTLDKPDASGRFRRPDENVHVVYEPDGTLLHLPPPIAGMEERLAALCAFANGNGPEFIHPVIKAIILHFWLAYEHPFYDGNGRVSRALFYWHMLKNGYWLFEFLPISRIFLQFHKRYMNAFLYTEYDDNDLTYFISFHIEAISRALEDFYAYLKRKQQELSAANMLIKRVPGLNERQYNLVAQALQNPGQVYTIQLHVKETGVVYQTARTDLLGLAAKGLFEAIKRGKRFIFVPAKDMQQKLESLAQK